MSFKTLIYIFKKLVLKLPLFLRDRIIVSVLNVPICTGSYDNYSEIVYGNDSYNTKASLEFQFTRFNETLKSDKKNIPVGRLSYPFWLLNESQVMKLFKGKYDKILDYTGQEMFVTKHKVTVKYRSILFTKI